MYCILYVIYYIYYIRIVLHYTYSPQRNNESVEKFITLLSYKLTFHKALQLICKSLIIRHHYIAFLLIKKFTFDIWRGTSLLLTEKNESH